MNVQFTAWRDFETMISRRENIKYCCLIRNTIFCWLLITLQTGPVEHLASTGIGGIFAFSVTPANTVSRSSKVVFRHYSSRSKRESCGVATTPVKRKMNAPCYGGDKGDTRMVGMIRFKKVVKAASSTLLGLGGSAGIAVAAATALASTTANIITLPSWKLIAASCLIPTCLGYYKREYGVSYAYGTSVSVVAYFVYRSIVENAVRASGGAGILTSNIATWHCLALIFYGIRLNAFLLYRELFVPSMKEMIKKIEEKATAKEEEISDEESETKKKSINYVFSTLLTRFKTRTPFILSCSLLYYGLCSPLFVNVNLMNLLSTTTLEVSNIQTSIVQTVMKFFVTMIWFGFILGMIGDITKSYVKAKERNKSDSNHLVSGGIYSILRHPNYTGEMISWTFNGLMSLFVSTLSLLTLAQNKMLSYNNILLPKAIRLIGTTLFGGLFINFVLLTATKNLEKKQYEKYGQSSKYKEWVEKSWVGFTLPQQVNAKDIEEELNNSSKIEPNPDAIDEYGSGI